MLAGALAVSIQAAAGDVAAGQPARPAAAQPPKPPVRIAAVGDLNFGITPSLPEGGAAGLLSDLRPLLEPADLALGNLETPLTDTPAAKCGAGSSGCFAFRAPPVYAGGIERVGLDVLNLANNHAYDSGQSGLEDTVAALRGAGLAVTGRPSEIKVLRAGRARVAFVGFAPYRWAQDLVNLAGARRIVARAKRLADLVVVTMHAGGEGTDRSHVRPGPETYLGEPRGNAVAFARAVVDAGADLVVGHGPHVLRGLEWYRGRLIAYSLGNASGHRTLSTAGTLALSAVLEVTLEADGAWRRGRLIPLRLDPNGRPSPDPGGESARFVAALSREDFGRRAARVDAAGAIAGPARQAAFETPAPRRQSDR